jgi:dTDP-4-dehydrorhamnose reductase
MDKTAVIGASGYLGRHLLAAFRREHPETVGTACRQTTNGLLPFDLRDPDLAPLRLRASGHRAVVLAAALPNIEQCETQPEETRTINVAGTLAAAGQAARMGLKVVFLSTDYVFDGETGRYGDDAPPHPITEYGRQKAEVEQRLPALAPRHLIVRLSKVFGLERGDGTLLDEMAARFRRGQDVPAAVDQVFCPTLVQDVVKIIGRLLDLDVNGLVNVCVPEIRSRYELAVELAERMRVPHSRVRRISLRDLPGKALRSLNTSMLCPRLQELGLAQFTPLAGCIGRVAENWAD